MPAVPALIMAGASAGGTLLGNKAARDTRKAAMQRTPEELALMQAQTGLANQQAQQGGALFGAAMPSVMSTLDYYRTLIDGSRAARMSAVSGETQDASQAYQGADAAVKKNLRGGERDEALANNATARAGAVSRLVTGVRPNAAAALGGLSEGLVGQSAGFAGQAGQIRSGLLNNETNNRQQAFQAGEQAGDRTASGFGQMFANLLPALSKIGGGGGKAPLTGANIKIPSSGSFKLPGAPMPPEVSY